MDIVAIKQNFVIYKTDAGALIAQPITQDARAVLTWNARHIPANDQ